MACASKSLALCSEQSDLISENQIQLTYRSPSQSLGLIVIMPPTGGSNFLDRQYADSLCEKGFETLILENWEGLNSQSLDLGIHKALLSRGQEVIDQVLKKYSRSYIGILGTSVGALHGATAFGRRKEIDAAFLIVGGGPIHKVIADSGEKTLKMYRRKRKEKFKFADQEAYIRALGEAIPESLDSLTYKEEIIRKPIALVIADEDKTVTSKYQKNWVEAFEPKETYQFNASHFWTIVKAWWFYEDKVSDFFLKHREKSPL